MTDLILVIIKFSDMLFSFLMGASEHAFVRPSGSLPEEGSSLLLMNRDTDSVFSHTEHTERQDGCWTVGFS